MKKGILRVVFVNVLAVSLLFLSGFSAFVSDIDATVNIKKQEYAFVNPEEQENLKAEEKEDKKEQETESAETVSSALEETSQAEPQQEEAAVQTDTEAVKGKIISQYNSPYVAKNSFDGVYLKNNTSLDISIKKYLEGKINFKIDKNSQPQVLIIHTHATETFKTDDKDYFTESFTSRTQNEEQNMISVGKIVAERLNSAGIVTLHDTTLHDYPSYSESYSRSAKTVTEYLKKYPSVKVVLDLHRDAVTKENGDKVKLVTQINGKNAAQVMLVQGSQSGSVTNFPNWEENFKLAVRLQQTMEKKYPTLARPLMLMSKNYNQSLTTGSLLIEFGTDVNTLSEVHYSAQLVGECLAQLLGNINS